MVNLQVAVLVLLLDVAWELVSTPSLEYSSQTGGPVPLLTP